MSSETFPFRCSELKPNSLDPALKFTSKLLGVQTVVSTSQQESPVFCLDTGLGPFFFQTNLAAIFYAEIDLRERERELTCLSFNLNGPIYLNHFGREKKVCECVCVCLRERERERELERLTHTPSHQVTSNFYLAGTRVKIIFDA